MVIHLRPYQRLALYHLRRSLEAGAWRQYLDLPTGTGKSTLAAAFAAQRLGQTQGCVLALVHRQDLALQLAETLSQEELEVGLVMEGSHTLHTPVVVATVQSLTPETVQDLLAANIPILTVLIDEAHHAVPGSVYERVLDAIEQAAGGQSVATIGLTATPYRNDERSMLSLLPVCAFARTIPEMVQEGYLAPLTWKSVQLDLDLAQVATTCQSGELDYAETTLAGQLLREAITARLVEHASPLIEQRPTLVFAASVQHAEYLSAAFRAYGFSTAVVSGRSSRRQRDELFARWKSGTIQVVCNCALLTEGYDFPGIAALVIARPTLSPGLYMLMLGRDMRKAEGKTDCLVIDVLGNQPDPRQQVVLPHVVGIEAASEDEGSVREPVRSRRSDPIFRSILGGRGETALALLDPLGRSHCRWTAYSCGYFARINAHVTAILERDPAKSGLYRSRQYARQPERAPEHQWIERRYLPLRQQVALVQEATAGLFCEAFASKEAVWLDEPATEKQLETLGRYQKRLPEQARAVGWTKREASEAIAFYQLRRVLFHAPDE